ncbi:DUF2116 family Zn-ribbon domain-containing protein [Streptomyces shenzhenensis]
MKIRPGQHYRLCSSACRRANYLKHQQKWLAEAGPPDPPEPALCPICGDQMPTPLRTCSDRCRQRAHRQQLRQPPTNLEVS